jgi:hypothetical protein
MRSGYPTLALIIQLGPTRWIASAQPQADGWLLGGTDSAAYAMEAKGR